MKVILLALAASLFTLVMMVQARGEPGAPDTPTASLNPLNRATSVNDHRPTRKDMAIWNARRKLHPVQRDD